MKNRFFIQWFDPKINANWTGGFRPPDWYVEEFSIFGEAIIRYLVLREKGINVVSTKALDEMTIKSVIDEV